MANRLLQPALVWLVVLAVAVQSVSARLPQAINLCLGCGDGGVSMCEPCGPSGGSDCCAGACGDAPHGEHGTHAHAPGDCGCVDITLPHGGPADMSLGQRADHSATDGFNFLADAGTVVITVGHTPAAPYRYDRQRWAPPPPLNAPLAQRTLLMV